MSTALFAIIGEFMYLFVSFAFGFLIEILVLIFCHLRNKCRGVENEPMDMQFLNGTMVGAGIAFYIASILERIF